MTNHLNTVMLSPHLAEVSSLMLMGVLLVALALMSAGRAEAASVGTDATGMIETSHSVSTPLMTGGLRDCGVNRGMLVMGVGTKSLIAAGEWGEWKSFAEPVAMIQRAQILDVPGLGNHLMQPTVAISRNALLRQVVSSADP